MRRLIPGKRSVPALGLLSSLILLVSVQSGCSDGAPADAGEASAPAREAASGEVEASNRTVSSAPRVLD